MSNKLFYVIHVWYMSIFENNDTGNFLNMLNLLEYVGFLSLCANVNLTVAADDALKFILVILLFRYK